MAAFNNHVNFTQSLYIGKDKRAEVLRRKEAAERELMEKREAKMREQSEKMERIRQQREAENREKIRRRQQRELERQKAVMDRRMAQLEMQNVKKEEILQRNHQQASRIAARPLLQQQQNQRSRFLVSGPATFGRSMVGVTPHNGKKKAVMGTKAQPANQQKQQHLQLGTSLAASNRRRLSPQPLSPVSALHRATMTQSLYSTPSPRNGPPQKQMTKGSPFKGQHQQKLKPVVIRPKKATMMMEMAQQNDQQQMKSIDERPPTTTTSILINDQIKQEVMDLSIQILENQKALDNNDGKQPKETIVVDETTIRAEHPMEEPDVFSNESSADDASKNDGALNRTYTKIGPDYLHQEGKQQINAVDQLTEMFSTSRSAEEQSSFLLDETAATLVPSSDQEISLLNEMTDDSGDRTLLAPQMREQNHSPAIGEEETTKSSKRGVDSSPSPPPKSISPAAAPIATILTAEQEESREMRRQKLNEILQRTRQQGAENNGGSSPLINNNVLGRIGNVQQNSTMMPLSAENPLLNTTANKNIDKRALAKELLAQRRQQKILQGQQRQQNGTQNGDVEEEKPSKSTALSLTSELAESRIFDNNAQPNKNNQIGMNNQQFYRLPGQIIDQPQESSHFSKPLLTSSPNVHQQQNDEKESPVGDNDSLLRTPPDDPQHMNGHHELIHPPEPNLIDLR